MYYFIVNEHGQGGKAGDVWRFVQKLMNEKGIAFNSFISQRAGHATEIASEICSLEDNDKKIIVVGGDGTINEVLNGITDFEHVSFGLIPTGSGNDFSRGMKVPRKTVKALEKILSSSGETRMDLGLVTAEGLPARRFSISSGIGLDAIVCKVADSSKLKKVLNKMHMGNLTYLLQTVHTLFSMTTSTVTVKLDGKEEKEYKKAIFLASMNLPTEGGGIPMSPKASAMDGKISLCMAYGIPKWLTFLLLPLLALGCHTKLKGFVLKEASTIEITSSDALTVHADGEYVGDVKSVKVECLRNALKVLV